MTVTLFALDFDGVICDSALETGLSAWRAARQIWPELTTEIPTELLENFRCVRPALETGFEGILILRALLDGATVVSLLTDFSMQMNAVKRQYQLDDDVLKSLFGTVRDQWIGEDFSGWIANNPLYPGMADFLREIPSEQLLIITTKQERFVSAILDANGIRVTAAQIYGLERQRSKNAILSEFAGQHNGAICFVEDRLPTLHKVISEPRLNNIDLWLADWGYNTEDDRHKAEQNKRIKTLALADLNRLSF